MSDECRSCRAGIVWTTTERGRNMPVDENAITVFDLVENDDGGITAVAEQRYVSHFATCPNADKHRKKG